MRSRLYALYDVLRARIAPRIRYSQEHYEEYLFRLIGPPVRWVDLGCGHQILPPWRLDAERELVARAGRVFGLDYVLPALRAHPTIRHRVRGDIASLPFASARFDLVTANMVVEHLAEPERQFREIGRILAPGGAFVFHTPNAYGYPTVMARLVPDRLKRGLAHLLDGRAGEDVFATHYRCNSRARVVAIASAAGLEVAEIRMIVSTPMFAVVPPLAALELACLRALDTRALEPLRTNLIVRLQKPLAQ